MKLAASVEFLDLGIPRFLILFRVASNASKVKEHSNVLIVCIEHHHIFQ